jgi:hypothetical protein
LPPPAIEQGNDGEPSGAVSQQQQQPTFSFAIHSQYDAKGDADNGESAEAEIECSTKLLSSLDATTSSISQCIVYLLSDHQRTIDLLAEWFVSNNNCTVVTTASSSTQNGGGEVVVSGHAHSFLRDLALGSQARTGAIGDPNLSSFTLLQAIIEYDRQMEALNAKQQHRHRLVAYIAPAVESTIVPPQLRCELKKKKSPVQPPHPKP